MRIASGSRAGGRGSSVRAGLQDLTETGFDCRNAVRAAEREGKWHIRRPGIGTKGVSGKKTRIPFRFSG